MGEKVVLEKVKRNLLACGKKKLLPGEFRDVVYSVRVMNGELLPIKMHLIEMGFPEKTAERITRAISYRFRFLREDAEEILKELEREGFLERDGFCVVIKGGSGGVTSG